MSNPFLALPVPTEQEMDRHIEEMKLIATRTQRDLQRDVQRDFMSLQCLELGIHEPALFPGGKSCAGR
jgi:hypothetical protein